MGRGRGGDGGGEQEDGRGEGAILLVLDGGCGLADALDQTLGDDLGVLVLGGHLHQLVLDTGGPAVQHKHLRLECVCVCVS